MGLVRKAVVAATLLWTGVTLWPVDVRAKETRKPSEVTLPAALRRSRSVGRPWQGHLMNGVKLEQNKHVRHVHSETRSGNVYGTWQLVQVLQRAAQRVAQRSPRAKLSVGELSAEAGGDLAGHASHESGRDVDVGFYMLDAAGHPYEAQSFANFNARGRGMSPNESLRFDTARNWDFISRLVTDAETRVQYVFVAPWIRQLLLDEGKRRGAPDNIISRASMVLTRANEKHPHANHFHVRVYCGPAERPRCVDEGTMWSWYPGAPPLPVASR
jgi:penicillin-insensitive murein endopeptidase